MCWIGCGRRGCRSRSGITDASVLKRNMDWPLWLAILGGAALALSIERLGRGHPGYRHVRDTISELGQTGAPQARLVAFGVFLPFGLAMAAVAAASRPASPAVALLAGCLAVGYVGAALFPCDPGSPLAGSWRQSLHNIAGAIQYVGGAYAIWQLGQTRPPLVVAAAMVGAAAVLLSVPAVSRWRGAIQRIAEAALLVSLVTSLAAGPV